MLKLVNIVKDYFVAGKPIRALKGINITFRDEEFVSILGPSGCGKTTTLNIIGGLDHYTDGDLLIDNISTKKYSDRDWDTYRNHRIGFVFQSYNLIPHQTVFENVELSLTISGMDKKSRIEKCMKVIKEVGLEKEINKRPNQLSGGQQQRVAIARALVNEPEILLLDEPTGALDTKTSIQILDLIKKVAKNKLVIMVTHNPDLAEKYSTRIIKLLDGEVVDDSNPIKRKLSEKQSTKNITKKSKLSFWQSFRLSARNLMSKRKRTIMTCFAGSIGIVGVALVLAVSNGIQNYIDTMQNDMLSGNPIVISESTLNINELASAAQSMKIEDIKDATKDGYVNVDFVIQTLIKRRNSLESLMSSNNINEDFVNFVDGMDEKYIASISKDYGIDFGNNIYTTAGFNGYEKDTMYSLNVIKNIYTILLQKTDYAKYSSFITGLSKPLSQSIENEEYIMGQYDIVSDPARSHYPTKKNEIMIVLSNNGLLKDLTLAQLGYFSQNEFLNSVFEASESEDYNPLYDKKKFSFDELLDKKFMYYPNNTVFNTTSISSPLRSASPFTYNPFVTDEFKNGIELTVTGILKPKDGLNYTSLDSGFFYTPELTRYHLENAKNSDIVKYLEDENLVDSGYTSLDYGGLARGITYKFKYKYMDDDVVETTGFVGNQSMIGAIIGGGSSSFYTLSYRELGGDRLPNRISIYPFDFDCKDYVTSYLDRWNSDEVIEINNKTLTKDDRDEIIYNDTLSIVINIISEMITMITVALVVFTALSLIVSTVMISIITYVSVVERVKEIGVIRALGGRKRDVGRLFLLETIIIGGLSGLFGVGVTYILSLILNIIIGSLAGIYTIVSLPLITAGILVLVSILLTAISGVLPAKAAARKDPVEALRTE